MLMDHLTETDDDLERSLESGFIIMQVNHHLRRRWKGLARPISLSCSPTISIRSSTSAVLISARFKCKRNVVDWVVRYHLRHSPPLLLVLWWVVGLLVPLASRRHRFHRLRSGLPQEGKMNGRSDGIRRDSLNLPTPPSVPVVGGWLMKALPTWHWTELDRPLWYANFMRTGNFIGADKVSNR